MMMDDSICIFTTMKLIQNYQELFKNLSQNSDDSLKSTKEFLRKEFPNIDHSAFFASFCWDIRSERNCREKGYANLYDEVVADHSRSDSKIGMAYEVQNKRCRLHLEARANSQPVKESHNCCILCDESIDWSHEGYSLIRCETKMSKNDICGHVAHINCALRSDFVGTVRGHDLEYLCKRCDKRTNLITHVEKLLDSCESIESQEDIEKLLKISADILRGSLQENALKLLYRIELATSKLRCGMDPKKIWQVQDDTSVLPSGAMPHLTNSTSLSGLEGINCQGSCERNTQGKHDQALYYMKQFSEEIDQVLRDLRKSQELEYRMAEEKLHDQKHRITTLLEQLDAEATKLARRTLSTKDSDVGALLTGITSTVNQIKQEVVKLEELKKVAQGLGKTPKSVLKEYFGMEIDD